MSDPGTVTWFNEEKGYGFIQPPAGPQIYVHHSAIEMEGFRTLKPGMKVQYEAAGPEEKPIALWVSPISRLA